MKHNFAVSVTGLGLTLIKRISMRFIACLLASVLFFGATKAAIPATYTITDLGISLGTNSDASGINNQGQVVGSWRSATGTRAFLYSDGTYSDLGGLGGANHYALNINSSGQVVGFGESAEGVRAFFFSNGSIRNLGAFGGLSSYAWGLNDFGLIVGHVTVPEGAVGFIYGNSGVTNLGTLGGTNSFGFGVNNSSLVVGSSLTPMQRMNAFLWKNGILTNLNDMLPVGSGWELQEARGINNSGWIVGWGILNGVEQAYLFKAGQVTGLGLLADTTNSYALGLNNLNQVVGSGNKADGINQAFLWNNGLLVNLNSLLPDGSGWDLREGRGINDSGQIVGWGEIGSEVHAFLLTPTHNSDDASTSSAVSKTARKAPIANLRKAPVGQTSFARAAIQNAMPLVSTNGRYAYFAFSDTTWQGERGQTPLAQTNAQNVPSWAGNCLGIATNSLACLKYREVEADGSTNANWWTGTIRFWLSPAWNSGVGPGREARLIEVGNANNTNGWWALLVSSNGNSIYMVTQTNSTITTNLSAAISFASNQWYQVAFAYSTNATAIYLNGTLATNGLGIGSIPSASIRSNGFSIGSDCQGTNQAKCRVDEMDTFDHPLSDQDVATDYQSVATFDSDSDGLPDIQEFIAGTDPSNPDTDGDGFYDGFEVAWGMNPLVANNPLADTDYDGRSDIQEEADGTNPIDPTSVNHVRLGYWRFGNTNWLGEQGQTPLFFTNLQGVATWVGKGVKINSGNPARLTYRDVETNGAANINCRSGSAILWFRPDWSSAPTGSGPQCTGRLLEMGTQGGTNDWWALLVNSNGTQIQFLTQSNGVAATNLSASIGWVSNQWHQIAITYSPDTSMFYLDGQLAVSSGAGITGYPRSSTRANGFSIGSDMGGVNQAKGTFDEVQTFNYPLSDSDISMNFGCTYFRDSDMDGLSDMTELQLGTDPNNPDSDGDGLLDGFEVQYGYNPFVWNNPYADSDYDGRNDIQEQADSTSPIDPTSVANVQLGYWQFNDTNWLGVQSQIPLAANNLQNMASWSGNALRLDSVSAARLTYRDAETNGSANINCRSGSLRFWFKPNWLTGTTNGGPGCEAGLIEMGTRAGTDWWALTVSSNGTQIHFYTRTNGLGMTNLAAMVDWQSNEWHQIVLTYSPTSSAFYLDGQCFEPNGAGASYYPRLSVRTNGFSIGSDMSGSNQAHGTFEELESFNYPLLPDDIAAEYYAIMAIDTDGNGVCDVLQDEGVLPPSTSGPPVLPVPITFNFWRFDTSNWVSSLGYGPRAYSNLVCTPSWSSNALWIDNTNPSFLRYNVFENDGHTNIDVKNGTLALWFMPDWSSTASGGTGPGVQGRLFEVGKWTSNANYGCWSLHFDSAGTNIVFETQNQFGGTVILQTNINWGSNIWHQIVLTYSRYTSTLYLDGAVAATGLGVVRWPSFSVQTNDGLCIGSDQTGVLQAKGQLENVRTSGDLWTPDTILNEYNRVEAILSSQQSQGMSGQKQGVGDSQVQGGVGPMDGLSSSTNLTLQIGPGTNQSTLTLTLLASQAGTVYRVFNRTTVSPGSTWQPSTLVTGLDSQTSWTVSNNGSNMFYTVVQTPQITSQPAGQMVLVGATVTFGVTNTGATPLSYQWRFNGTNISGATSASYSFPNATTNSAGNYSLVITNVGNAVTSSNAVLVVIVPVSISQQPTNQSVGQGTNATFNVTASGTAPLSYQWRFNGTNISGATNASYALSAQTGNAGGYSVVITNLGSSVTSSVASLAVTIQPSISQQPTNRTVGQGTNVTFAVTAGGTTPLSYQWRLNGSNIGNATNATYSLFALTSNAGNYSVVITNVAGAITSANAALVVNLPPSISQPPTNQTVIQGSNATFTVTANGTAPLSYQWQFSGTNIAGATTNVYTQSNAQLTNSGSYTVIVTNAWGSISSVAYLTIIGAPVITNQPLSQTINQGANVTFSAGATGTGPLAYQWRFNGTNIPGANTNTLLVTSVQAANAGPYSLMVTNSAGITFSSNAVLTVNLSPSIVTQPASVAVGAGTNTTFSVNASGAAPLYYQWRLGGTNISGATSSSYALTALTNNAGSYSVLITNMAGSLLSSTAVLTVNVGPVITAQPTNLTVIQGSNATFSVSANGTSPLAYQWFFNNNSISGGTSTTFTQSNCQQANAGNYFVVITNMAGVVTSSVASLIVNGPPVITNQPASQTNNGGSTVYFSVGAMGPAPLAYRWNLNGTALNNIDRISGADTAQLKIIDISSADAGNYTVTVTNVAGQVTSATAVLTVSNNVPLSLWHFDTNTWPAIQVQSQLAIAPMSTPTNLVVTTNAVITNAVQIDNIGAATLAYHDVEANNSANITFRQGSVSFYFAPDWSSGAGPTNEGRFVELGYRDSTNGWWALVVNTNGTLLSFITQTNGLGTTNLAAPINWLAGQWHQVVLTYCSTNSSLYVDGLPVINTGSNVVYWPSPAVRALGLRIGSDSTGTQQIRGVVDELETFNYPMLASDVATAYAASALADSDADGLPNNKEKVGNSTNPESNGDGLSDYFDWLHNITVAQGKPSLDSLTIPTCPK